MRAPQRRSATQRAREWVNHRGTRVKGRDRSARISWLRAADARACRRRRGSGGLPGWARQVPRRAGRRRADVRGRDGRRCRVVRAHRVRRGRLCGSAGPCPRPASPALHRRMGELVPHVPQPQELRLPGPLAATARQPLRVAVDRHRARRQRGARDAAACARVADALRPGSGDGATGPRMARLADRGRARGAAGRRRVGRAAQRLGRRGSGGGSCAGSRPSRRAR